MQKIKVAKKIKAYGADKATEKEVLAAYAAGETITAAEMKKLACADVGSDEFGAFVALADGRIFLVKKNRAGNVSELAYFADSAARKVRQIAAHTDREFLTVADRAAFLVNGMYFPNGGSDGLNTVKVRTFTKRPVSYLCAAEIYDGKNCLRVELTAGAKVWGNDCADVEKVAPIIDEQNAFALVFCRRTMWVCVRGWED